MQSIETYNFKGKKALIRVDFNVPLDDEYKVTDDTRIKAALPTIEKILNDNGSVILMSHLGRPKGVEERFSLKHIVNHISKLTGRVINFADDCIGENAINMANDLKEGEILLLENLRFHPEEKKGDLDFAKRLAMLGDCWVNDAFGTAHRAHSSTAIISQFFPNDKMFGYLINNELKSVDKFINSSVKPVTAIMGGAKVSSKIGIIKNLMNKVDNIIIGGGMTFTFVKAMGGKIGNSLVENDKLFEARELLKEAKEKGVNFIISVDALCGDKFDNNANTKTFSVHEIPEGWIGLDAGEESIKNFKNVIENSKTILWNGPVGVFEMPSFEKGTKEVAYSVAKATSNGVFTLIGGGDSVAAANQYGVADKVSYVSTGGGALLEYIEGKELPGIEAVRK